MTELTKEMITGTILEHVYRFFHETPWMFGVVMWCKFCEARDSAFTASTSDEQIWAAMRKFYARHKHCTATSEPSSSTEFWSIVQRQMEVVKAQNKDSTEAAAASKRRISALEHIGDHPWNKCRGCLGCDVDKIFRA